MPSNYVGVPGNVAPAALATFSIPIDGDSDNGASFQTQMQAAADYIEYLRSRLESMLTGPAALRNSMAAFLRFDTSLVYAGAPQIAWSASLGSGLGRFCVVGFAAGPTSVCQTSDDGGLTWTTRASFNTAMGANQPTALLWNSAQPAFVAVGDGGKIVTSADGITWTSQTSGTGNSLKSIAYSDLNGTFIVGGDSVLLKSTNLTAWSAITLAAPQNAKWNLVTYGHGPNLFVDVCFTAGATANAILTSPDGTTWTQRTAPAASLMNVGYAPFATPLFVAVSQSTAVVYTSPDGINWTSRALGSSVTQGRAGVYFTGSEVLVMDATQASGGAVHWRSRDGITFTPFSSPGGTGAVQSCNGLVMVGGGAYWLLTATSAPTGVFQGPTAPII